MSEKIPDADLAFSAHFEAVAADERERFRSFLADQGPRGVDALRAYDRKIADILSGVCGARGTWHALSNAQRNALVSYNCMGRAFYAGARERTARTATLENLRRRGLVDDDGITEKGRFVVLRGPG